MAKRRFVESVRAFLEKKKWDQAQLAKRSGLSPTLISKILSGDRDLTISNILAIARALNVSAADLVAGDDLAEALLVEVVPRADYAIAENERIEALIQHDAIVLELDAKKAEADALRAQLGVATRDIARLTKERAEDRAVLQRTRTIETQLERSNLELGEALLKIEELEQRVSVVTNMATTVTNNLRACEQSRSEIHRILVQAQKELREMKTLAGAAAVGAILALATKK